MMPSIYSGTQETRVVYFLPQLSSHCTCIGAQPQYRNHLNTFEVGQESKGRPTIGELLYVYVCQEPFIDWFHTSSDYS